MKINRKEQKGRFFPVAKVEPLFLEKQEPLQCKDQVTEVMTIFFLAEFGRFSLVPSPCSKAEELQLSSS